MRLSIDNQTMELLGAVRVEFDSSRRVATSFRYVTAIFRPHVDIIVIRIQLIVAGTYVKWRHRVRHSASMTIQVPDRSE